MKKLISGVLSVAMSILCILPVSAQPLDKKSWETPTEFNGAEKYGNISEKETIIIEGELQPLLVTYDNRKNALENFKKVENNKNYLLNIEKKYSLESISNKNYKEYSSIAIEELMDSDNNEYINEKNELSAVLSIYADDDLNTETKELYKKYQINNDNISMMELTANLPNFAPIINKLSSQKPTNRVYNGFNASKANNYAYKYAKSRNTAQYKSLTGDARDCANFVSQILYAGGLPKSNVWRGSKIYNSPAWGKANELANYYGRRNATRNFGDFENQPWGPWVGDVIGFSTGNNGFINHVAYVAGKASGVLCIAQHSGDYYGWTNGVASGWRKTKATFYIIGGL